MVFKRESIDERLKKLAGLYSFFELHKNLSYDELVKDITVSLAVERASALAAEIIIDIMSHLLASEQNCYPETYEETIELSSNKSLISEDLYKKIKGLGGYRNILVHEYLGLDYDEVHKHFKKLIGAIPKFQEEILRYMDKKTE
jgi:uncharacterized protein YutE (UPF0331/DUF86 family)